MPNYEAIEKAVANNSRYNDINILQEDGSAVSLLKKYGLLLNKGYPKIGKAEPLKMLVQVPGGGVLNLSGALTGKVNYIKRQITMQFSCFRPQEQWYTIQDELEQQLHGKWIWFYQRHSNTVWRGQASVSMARKEKYAVVSVSVICSPYGENLTASKGQNYLWDSFNFETDTIYTVPTEVKQL